MGEALGFGLRRNGAKGEMVSRGGVKALGPGFRRDDEFLHLVADDQCAIAIGEDGQPRIHPDGRQLRLWDRSIEKLELDERRGPAMRDRLQKFYVDPHGASAGPVAIGAVYALAEARGKATSGIEPADPIEATRLLTANAYRPSLIAALGQQAEYFRGCTAIANVAGVFTLTRPLGFDRIAETIAQLERHWAATASIRGAAA